MPGVGAYEPEILRLAAREPAARKALAGRVVRAIRCTTRKQHSAEEKIRIVLESLRGEESISALCQTPMLPTDPA